MPDCSLSQAVHSALHPEKPWFPVNGRGFNSRHLHHRAHTTPPVRRGARSSTGPLVLLLVLDSPASGEVGNPVVALRAEAEPGVVRVDHARRGEDAADPLAPEESTAAVDEL